MRKIATLYDPEEAQVAASFLRAYGFDAFLADSEMLMQSPTHRIALGGFRVMVPHHQADEAEILLKETRQLPNQTSTPCPTCGGADYRRVKSWWFPAIFFFTLGAVVPFAKNSHYLECRQCKTRITRDYIDGSENI